MTQNKINPFTESIKSYLFKTPWYRKILDTFLICLVLLFWGIASGKVSLETKFYNPSTHTIEHTLQQSSQVQKVIDGEQYKNDYRFIGSFKFHNGTVSLDGYNFMKYTLTEYSSQMGTLVDSQLLQNVPIVMNNKMIRTLADGKCYTGYPDKTESSFLVYEQMEVTSYTACPVYSLQKHLSGFILVAVRNTPAPSHSEVVSITDKISIYRK